jgi:cytochrome o ubiquinol oxidase subunit IV
MNKHGHENAHHKPVVRHDEHKTIDSYIVGFVLSLIFTAIPYYMVVNQTVTGTLLLLTILGFAVLQMLIQIFFFLHLGRGPKPLYNVVFFASTVGIILVVVGGSVVIISNLHRNKSPIDQSKSLVEGEGIYQINGEYTGACHGQYANHQVTIINSLATPEHTNAKKCDTLTFINKDSVQLEITFGAHPEHKSYAGESVYVVRSGKNKTITLSESGTYQFHDHLQPMVAGGFTVTQ